ncbi:MAG TPA: hypothetical protein VFR04_04325 [Solirubrobacterales bacterium]|nr:hypothetical protein [Solirubrobacterales bacterium]
MSRAAALCCALAALAVATVADGALVRVNGIVLHADGGFQPQALPRHDFAPIEFQGHFEVDAQGGGRPVVLQEAVIDFDRDGRLLTAGLPTCAPEQVANAGVAEARAVCRGAIVGTGQVEATIEAGGGAVPVSSALTIFNGPPQGGNPTAVLHARTPAPGAKTFAILVPIERRPGAFRYRATLAFPELAGGLGSITRVEAEVGRRFRRHGRSRSYVSARCSDGILRTHGRFTFADGTIIDGSVEKACSVR